MSAQTLTEPFIHEGQASRWNLTSRVAFRLCFAYLGFFCLSTQIATGMFSGTQGADIPDPGTLWPLRPLVFSTASHIFHVRATLAFEGNSASGDDIYGWVLAFCLLGIAFIVTGIWSALDSLRENYVGLHRWFRFFIRFCLAGQMLNYGFAKVIPTQMPYPSLVTLIERFGDFSPMGVLWSSIGSSQPYEVFAGCAEVLAGLLLIVPHTTLAGALICIADMIQVFMLNMTYDVPVKLFSFHLIVLAVVLLIPDLPRLGKIFFLNRATAPSQEGQFFATRRANSIALVAQVLFGLWLVSMNANTSRHYWYIVGGGRPTSPLYGIWDVDQLSVDGQLRPPLKTDSNRWQRLVFDLPTQMVSQRMNDSLEFYSSSFNLKEKTLVLTKNDDEKWKAKFTFMREDQHDVILDGEMEGRSIHMQLQLVDRNGFLLVSRGFHWIQDYPLNR